MTFTDIQTEILDRLGLTSTDDTTRIGRAINRVYRTVTSALGIKHVSRRTTVQATTTLGVSSLSFTGAEKVVAVFNRNVTPYKQLEEVTVDELRAEQPFSASDTPTKYAVESIAADTVTVLLNCTPQTAFALYADVYATGATLSGSDEPAFSESYHDILIHGVLVDEYLKLEKPGLSTISEKRYDKRMGELQLWIAVSTTKQIHQGKTRQLRPGASAGGSGSATNGALSYTQTGLITFDRSAAGDVAPFAVDADADAVVTNLDADKLDGQHGSYYRDASNLNAGTLPDARFPATLPAVSGANLTNLDASDLASGTVSDARLATTIARLGTANTGGHLLFTDATYDIGASGATRPRDLFLSRNAVIGGTLAVTDATTLEQVVMNPASGSPDQGLVINTTGLANGSNAFFMNAPSGWTGNLFKGNLNNAEVFAITEAGTAFFARGTATPAGGSATARIAIGSAVFGVYVGSGVPTVSAAKGSLYLRSDGTTTNNRAYINTDGATTWTAIVTAG